MSTAGNQRVELAVCRAMTTARRALPSILAIATLVAACTAAGPSPTTPSASLPPTTAPSEGPSAIDLPTTDPGGGAPGDPGSGVVDPGAPGASLDPNDPAGGGVAQLVRPRPGQKNPHPVAPTKLETSIDGRHVLVKVSWYSGVEPCSVLDSVKVERSSSDIAITPLEGIGDPNAICIDIAVLKATIVDLGELEPGTWRISAPSGSLAPVEITID